jgi:sugar lactone lactonase YvrE
LYVVHHGNRESIEVFEFDARAKALTWIGCAVAPEPIGLNSVVALPDGGFASTNFRPRGAARGRANMEAGEKNGELWEWHAASGWKKVPGSEAAGANGIEISNDGKWYYVAAWGSQSFFRLSRGTAAPMRDEIRLGFRVDNIRWGKDGSLYAAGQTGSREVPETSSVVVKINPDTLAVREVYRRPDDATFRAGTVAVEVGNDLWVGSYLGDRIAVVRAN